MRLRNSAKMSQGTNHVKKRLNFKTPKAGEKAHKRQKKRGWLISALSLARAPWTLGFFRIEALLAGLLSRACCHEV